LEAVALIGNYWADISSLFVPHRERGHLRKRYQVLERRVKATVKRKGKMPPLCDQSKTSSSEFTIKGKRIETNDGIVNQTMGVKLPKSHNDDILESQNLSAAAPNDTVHGMIIQTAQTWRPLVILAVVFLY
jgi:hypothetical protein